MLPWEIFEIFTRKIPFPAILITHLLENLVVKNTNFTLIYKFPKYFNRNCSKNINLC